MKNLFIWGVVLLIFISSVEILLSNKVPKEEKRVIAAEPTAEKQQKKPECLPPVFSENGEIVGNLSGISPEGWPIIKDKKVGHITPLYGLSGQRNDWEYVEWVMSKWSNKRFSCKPLVRQVTTKQNVYRCTVDGVNIADEIISSGKMTVLHEAVLDCNL